MNRVQCVHIVGCLATLVLSGCGGGSGNSPSVSIDRTTVSVSATVTDSAVNTPTVTVTVSNAPSKGVYIAGSTSKNGVSTLSPGIFSTSTAAIQIFLKAPYTLAPATYSDTVTLEACVDQACTQQISGSPLTVKVTYTIAPPPAGATPTMAVSSTTILVQALPTGSAPPAGVAVTVAHAPSFPLTAKVTSTANAVLSATFPSTWNAPPQLGFGVTLELKAPGQLSPGVYTDQLTVEVCLDPACVNPLAGSPQTLTITYQIGNNLPGRYAVTQISVQGVDLVVDNQRSLLYVAVPASASVHPSTIAIVDPVNSTVTSFVPSNFDPGKLAISDDGSFLYVGENNGPHIARFALPTMTLGATIILANDSQGQTTWPIDIKVQPGSPKSIAVARDFKDDTAVQGDGVVIYDDVTARPNIGGLDAQGGVVSQIGFLAWSSGPGTLYGSGRGEVDVLSVDSTGAQVTTRATGHDVGRIQYVGAALYADSGTLFNPMTLAISAVLPTPSYPGLAVTADASVPRIYKITSTGGGGTYLYQYDTGTFAPHGTADILGVYVQYLVPSGFTRWGTNGLAFLATDQQAAVNAPNDLLILISGPFVTQ